MINIFTESIDDDVLLRFEINFLQGYLHRTDFALQDGVSLQNVRFSWRWIDTHVSS